MKKILIFLFAFTLYGGVHAQKNATQGIYNGHVEFVQKDDASDGTVTVNATGFSKKIADSKVLAIQSAFFNLLFRGIAGSKYNLPLVPDEEKKNDPIVKKLLKDGYSSYITNNTIVEEDKKERKIDGVKGYQCIMRMTINVDALRRYLEQNNIIRKFGF